MEKGYYNLTHINCKFALNLSQSTIKMEKGYYWEVPQNMEISIGDCRNPQ